MRHIATPIARFVACLTSFAQSQQPSPTPPPADRKTVLQRAIDMYEAKKYPTAMLAFHEAAAAGSAEAAEYLGVMYSEGQGTSVNYEEAMIWLRKAAAAGDGQAMCNIGILYYRGTGAPQRYDLALRWFRDAATAGNSQAMFNIGAMYRDGVGETVDFGEAMNWSQSGGQFERQGHEQHWRHVPQRARSGHRLRYSGAVVPPRRGPGQSGRHVQSGDHVRTGSGRAAGCRRGSQVVRQGVVERSGRSCALETEPAKGLRDCGDEPSVEPEFPPFRPWQ